MPQKRRREGSIDARPRGRLRSNQRTKFGFPNSQHYGTSADPMNIPRQRRTRHFSVPPRPRNRAGRARAQPLLAAPGAFCTNILAELGAEVVKVERPEGGDYRSAGMARMARSRNVVGTTSIISRLPAQWAFQAIGARSRGGEGYETVGGALRTALRAAISAHACAHWESVLAAADVPFSVIAEPACGMGRRARHRQDHGRHRDRGLRS